MANLEDSDYILMVVEILHTGNWLDNKISKILNKAGITHVQFNILRILQGAHPEALTVGAVKDRILFSNSDITRLLDRLKEKGLIGRNICETNRRKMDVNITISGLELIKYVLPEIGIELEGFYKEKLTAIERNQLVSLLKKIKLN